MIRTPSLTATVAADSVGNAPVEQAIGWTTPWAFWITIVIVAVVAGVAVYAYLRERGTAKRWQRILLAGFRISLVVAVAWMLHEFFVQQFRTDLPDLVVVVDDSKSMLRIDTHDQRHAESVAERLRQFDLKPPSRANQAKSVLLAAADDLRRQYRDTYNLRLYTIGESIEERSLAGTPFVQAVREIESDGSESALGKGVLSILKKQRGRRTAAMIVLTDGNTTRGPSLQEAANRVRQQGIKLYLIGVGSDSPQRDVRVSDLMAPAVAFVGEQIGFEFSLAHTGLAGRKVNVRLRRGDAPDVIAEREILLSADAPSQRVRFLHHPKEKGRFEYVVSVASVKGERDPTNNRLAQSVLVRDDPLRVLMVQNYPSYEFRYLKGFLNRLVATPKNDASQAIDLSVVLQQADSQLHRVDQTFLQVFPQAMEELLEYDVVVFGDVDPTLLGEAAMDNLAKFVREHGRGIAFIAGPKFTPLAYQKTPLEPLFPFELSTARAPAEDTVLNEPFRPTLTPLGDEVTHLQLSATQSGNATLWRTLPELYWSLATPNPKLGAIVLAEHSKEKSPDGAPLPLISMRFVGEGRVSFQAFDGSWRWRFRRGDKVFGRYWLQTLRFLRRIDASDSRTTVVLQTDNASYQVGDPVTISARFFDEQVAPVADDGVVVLLRTPGQLPQRVVLRRKGTHRGVFETVLSNLEAGHCTAEIVAPKIEPKSWNADDREGGEPPPTSAKLTCEFDIVPPRMEDTPLPMNASELAEAAKAGAGRFFAMKDAERAFADLPTVAAVRREPLSKVPIWNTWWVAAAFLAVITMEWLLRRRWAML
jgi:hypothetical protein